MVTAPVANHTTGTPSLRPGLSARRMSVVPAPTSIVVK